MTSNDDRSSKSIWENLESEQEPEQVPEELEHVLPEPAESEPDGASVAKFPRNKYVAYEVDAKALQSQGAMVLFPGLKRVVPKWESTNNNIAYCIFEVAPEQAAVIAQKDRVPYFIAGTLKEAELKKGGCEQLGVTPGSIGKQRSSAHIASLGPLFVLDDDQDVFARESKLKALGWFAVIYSSWSYMHPDPRGRVILLLNRTLSPDEYRLVWDAINQLLGGGFDEAGQSTAQCYGIHARRSEDAPSRREILQGGALDADALIELGRSLQPQRPERETSTSTYQHSGLANDIERVKLMGAVRPPNEYDDWFPGAAAFKRAYPDNEESAFQCFDAWSACSPEYKDTEEARCKFDKVPKDHDGAELTVAIMYARARRRALMVLNTLYPAQLGEIVIAEAFKNRPIQTLGEGIELGKPLKGDEPIAPGSIGPKDGLVALEFLLFCFGEKSIEGISVPAHVLEKARGLTSDRRERIDLNGRKLHIWNGGSIPEGTYTLANDFLASSAKLYSCDGIPKVLMRLSSPADDPTTAARIRELHGYKGKPGDPDDPAQGKGMRQVPFLSADKPALRAFIGEVIATEKQVKTRKDNKEVYTQKICSFAFKSGANPDREPDGSVLDDLLKRVLPERAPEIRGIISAPLTLRLPTSTRPQDLLRPDAATSTQNKEPTP